MCFHSKQSKKAQEVENRFNAKILNPELFQSTTHYNGFEFPKTPVITNLKQDTIQQFNWGLIPHWSKDENIRKYTLNARIETITEKPSFKNNVKNRCLILADGFYEWQWLTKSGSRKQKYLITKPNEELYAYAGIFSEWLDKSTGEIINSYSIVTTQANELMAEIHNVKKRMPIILNSEDESKWLNGEDVKYFSYPYETKLEAVKV